MFPILINIEKLNKYINNNKIIHCFSKIFWLKYKFTLLPNRQY